VAINKLEYLVTVLKTDPLEIVDIAASVMTTIKYRYLRRCVGKNSIIRRNTRITNCRNVSIGNNCILQDNVYIRAGAKGKVVFGKGCMVNSFTRFFGHGGIIIGDESQFGPGVTITTTEHDYTKSELPEIFKQVTIGKRVWMGSNVTILPGITIGDNSVIGAGSVVTKDIPPNSVAVGVPAKVIKEITPNHNK